jgi:hypothetical protein
MSKVHKWMENKAMQQLSDILMLVIISLKTIKVRKRSHLLIIYN